MVGMVNSLGAYSASREQAALTAREMISISGELGNPPMWVRPHESTQPNRVDSRSLVAAEPDSETSPAPPTADETRQSPAGNAQSPREAAGPTPTQALGRVLDLSA